MDSLKLDYDAMAERIEAKLLTVAGDTPIVVEQERQFLNTKLDPSTIYFVVSFSSAATTFGQCVVEAKLTAISERNAFQAAREMLALLASKYTLKQDGDFLFTISTPRVLDAFTDFGNGFQTSLETTITIVVNASDFESVGTLYYEGEEVPILSFADTYTNSLRPQPLPSQDGFAKSVSGFASYSFSISTFMKAGGLCKAINNQKYGKNSEDTSYYFTLELKKTGKVFEDKEFKLASATTRQEAGDACYITATFTL